MVLELPIGAEGWENARAHLVWDPALAPTLTLSPFYLTPDGREVPVATPYAVAGGAVSIGVSCAYSLRLRAVLAAPGPAALVFVSWVRGCSASVGFTTT